METREQRMQQLINNEKDKNSKLAIACKRFLDFQED